MPRPEAFLLKSLICPSLNSYWPKSVGTYRLKSSNQFIYDVGRIGAKTYFKSLSLEQSFLPSPIARLYRQIAREWKLKRMSMKGKNMA